VRFTESDAEEESSAARVSEGTWASREMDALFQGGADVEGLGLW